MKFHISIATVIQRTRELVYDSVMYIYIYMSVRMYCTSVRTVFYATLLFISKIMKLLRFESLLNLPTAKLLVTMGKFIEKKNKLQYLFSMTNSFSVL